LPSVFWGGGKRLVAENKSLSTSSKRKGSPPSRGGWEVGGNQQRGARKHVDPMGTGLRIFSCNYKQEERGGTSGRLGKKKKKLTRGRIRFRRLGRSLELGKEAVVQERS